jgi:hypothetical protein
MDSNVGNLDRLLRVVFGFLLLSVPFTNFLTSDWIGQLMAGVAIIIGVTLILSGALARCFVYKFLGINTCNIS